MQTPHAPEPPRLAILVPTTGGCARVASLERRPRLARSMATHVDDFRPLPIAEGYHRLVEGPLATHDEAPTPWHLALTERIDTGRSWELPVVLAHRAVARGARLSDVTEADTVIWATGAVDAALAPAGEARYLAEKLAHSAPSLDVAGPRAHFLVAVDAPDGALVAEAARRIGGTAHTFSTFEDIERMLDAVIGSRTPAPANPPAGKGEVRTAKPAAILIRAAVLAALAAAIAFGVSILGEETGTGERLAAMIRMEQLTAPTREACIDAVLSGGALTARRLPLDEPVLEIPATPATCALRFVTLGATPVTVRFDDRLQDTLIAADAPVGRAITVVNGSHYTLVFRASPAGRTTGLTLGAGGREERRTLAFGAEDR
ncbi:hypothetical protein [Acuticoccus sediminis]|nr:hypothetical protein [Acuticoccus sediminis]